jgi:hypothetical protein
VVDGMIHCIEANNMEKSADAMFVKRILLSQQQQEQMGKLFYKLALPFPIYF